MGKHFADGTKGALLGGALLGGALLGGSSHELDRRTLVDTSIGLWDRPPMSASMAFPRYLRELSSARIALSDDHVFVAVVDSGGEANRIATLAPGESLILGRHKNCELRIEQPNMGLRQVALHVGHASTGVAPFLRVWDLHTGKTLTCEDGASVEALASDGPVFLSLGRYHLAFIPLGQLPPCMPVDSNEAWASLPQRAFLSAMAEGTGSRLVPQVLVSPSLITSITRMPSSIGLEALEASPVAPEAAVGSLVVQGQSRRREFQLGIEHLERGILIGRYGRCLGRGLDATVSRVHLMLASVGGEIVAIDTASTVGCKLGDSQFHSKRLDRPSKIWLGKHSYLIWSPSQIAAC